MENRILDTEEKLSLMQELLTCGTDICLWSYAADGHLSNASSPHLVLDQIFEHTGQKDFMIDYGKQHTEPLILGGQLGLMWCAVFQRIDDSLKRILVMGPVFHTNISKQTIEQSARDFQIDLAWRNSYTQLLSQLPIISSVMFFQYALMLHYCLTGERLTRSDIQFRQQERQEEALDSPKYNDRRHVWLAERTLLQMVREGDLNYQKALSDANLLSNGIQAGEKQPVLQAIVSCTSFTSLCVREAINGGLSPDTAYSVGDSYIQAMLDCKTIPELRSLNHTMYEDFIMRVHKLRTHPDTSPQIQACCDYIELHSGDELSLPFLAGRAGYSEYYLSRKFKQEIGISITAYIRKSRVERAKTLLASTSYSLRDITESLRFCSQSHLTKAFREYTGMTPAEYREKYYRI